MCVVDVLVWLKDWNRCVCSVLLMLMLVLMILKCSWCCVVFLFRCSMCSCIWSWVVNLIVLVSRLFSIWCRCIGLLCIGRCIDGFSCRFSVRFLVLVVCCISCIMLLSRLCRLKLVIFSFSVCVFSWE